MAGPDTWAAGLLSGGMGKDMVDARRRYEILKAELEAIRRGTKTANRAELRRLERELKAAQEAMAQAQAAEAPPVTGPAGQPSAMLPPTRARAAMRQDAAPRRTVAPIGDIARSLRARPPGAIRGPMARATGPSGGVGATPGGALGVTTPRGYPTVQAQGGSPLFGSTAAVTGGAQPGAGGGIIGRILDLFRGKTTPGGLGTAVGGMAGGITPGSGTIGGTRTTPGPGASMGAGLTWRDKPQAQWTGADYMAYQQWQQAQAGKMTQYQQGSLAQRQAESAAQQAQQQAQLQQAWAIAQQELAHAQNVMAANIGMGASELQGQMWSRALPHALPKGTQVAPGFERGGPMQQMYRMSGSQFAPGRTGAISPYPQPSMDQIMQWVQQAMGKYGAGG